MDSTEIDNQAKSDLQTAFAGMLAELEKAREAIDDPALKPPPATARNLAEGYRYLSGYLFAASERAFAEDVDFPYFRRAIQTINKSTWDNADNLYLSAPIDGSASYRIRCKAQDTAHWRGGTQSKPSAPWYLIFTAITHYTGDTGSLAELTPATTNNGGSIDSSQLQLEADGSFEIILAPEKPAGFNGNFICTRTEHEGVEQQCNYIICRELFADWENEQAIDMNIVRLDKIGQPQPAITPEKVIANFDSLGKVVNAQMRFWNDFFATILDGYGDSPLKTPVAFPGPNKLNNPAPPTAQVGAAQATNVYSGGMYLLEEDEALIIEQTIPVKPDYTGFNLNNIWGESFDYTNYQSSLNNLQAQADSDGKVRYVIAHKDPGVNNWLDTTGHNTGMLSQRWAYTDLPEQLPTLVVTKVPFDQVLQHLPTDTVSVSAEQRLNEIRIRQEHTQRRFRQY
jgi:hypothetical protein